MPAGQLPQWHNMRRLTDLSTQPPFEHTAAAINLARRWVDRIHARANPTKGLLLHGPTGAGKTTVAAAVAVEVDAAFWGVRDLIASVKSEFGHDVRYPVVERCVRAPILVLDDIGVNRSTDFVRETVQDILARRFDRWAPDGSGSLTVTTTNLSVGGLRQLLGDQVVSRLLGSSVVVPVEGADMRVAV